MKKVLILDTKEDIATDLVELLNDGYTIIRETVVGEKIIYILENIYKDE